jgi:hypothetical protein
MMKVLKISAAVVIALSLTLTHGMRLGDIIRSNNESQCFEIGGRIINMKGGQKVCLKTDRE